MSFSPMRAIGRLVVYRPGLVIGCVLAISALLYLNIHKLRTGSDLTDLFGSGDPQWKEAGKIGKELGYGNQLYVMIEAPQGDTLSSEAMEGMATQLTAEMRESGLFKQARCGLEEEELTRMVRFFTWNFPSLTPANRTAEVKARLQPKQIRATVKRAAAELVTPFSPLGADYFVADPLGLLPVVANDQNSLSQFAGFDLTWGSGNRFFSKDHRSLLIIAEPVQSAVDYNSAGKVVQWTRERIQVLAGDPSYRDAGLRGTPAGAYVYAEQDHKFIEQNIRRISLISIIGNLVLCLLIYPRIPMLLLSLLPASLGILWTTGIASIYPGEINLISLSFIAILAGLGDDQVVHLFNRVPQEWAKGGTPSEALLRALESTGTSVIFCILTAATATAALATSGFKALAEFGFILTVGMFMMMVHTLFTVPALMQLWWRFSQARAPLSITFRFLPWMADKSVRAVCRHARLVCASALVLFLLCCWMLPRITMGKRFDIASADNPAVAAQKQLSERFGIEGNPTVLLVAGDERTVLTRTEALTGALDALRRKGKIRSVFSPTGLLPSPATQTQRAAGFAGTDLESSARALEAALHENGLASAPHRAFIERLRQLGDGSEIVTLAQASEMLPSGLLDNSLRRLSDGSYVAAIAYYSTSEGDAAIPDSTINSWRSQFGPFIEFSFDKMSRDLQARILHDSRKALLWTALGLVLIIYLTFRNLRDMLLVLMPIIFAIVTTFGLLALVGHRFSFMCITAIPLILGIGIDNGIHVVRRYREREGQTIVDVARDSGAAVIQSNLTTMIGFGALMASGFAPLAELGRVTCLGVALALAGGLWLLPSVLSLMEGRNRLANSKAVAKATQAT